MIFSFLTELAKNNNKEWFDAHKEAYEGAKLEATLIFNYIYAGLAEHDTLAPLKIYRIYRDLRFSKDKTPYKTHFGCYIQRKQPHYRGGYYVHISPQETFIGGGFFDPNKEDLLRIRQEISLNAEEFTAVMNDKGIVEQFGGKLWGDEVKTAPKGFEKDDPMIAYLRKKQFLLKHDYTREEATKGDFDKKVVKGLLAMRPFLDFMTEALTTNLNGEVLFW
ncbi:TIGR02453 family protein [Capnocytophaga sp. HP1101]